MIRRAEVPRRPLGSSAKGSTHQTILFKAVHVEVRIRPARAIIFRVDMSPEWWSIEPFYVAPIAQLAWTGSRFGSGWTRIRLPVIRADVSRLTVEQFEMIRTDDQRALKYA